MYTALVHTWYDMDIKVLRVGKPAPKPEREEYCVDGPNGPQMSYKEDRQGSHIIEKRGVRTDHWC